MSCQKELSIEDVILPGTIDSSKQNAVINLTSISGQCLDIKIEGIYKANDSLTVDNKLAVKVNVTRKGAWDITTDTTNGVYFKGKGVIETIGDHTIFLQGIGKPAVSGNYTFKLKTGDIVCSITITVETNGTTPPTQPIANKPPIARAGADQTINLPSNSLTLKGSGEDIDGNVVEYKWLKISGPSATIVSPNQPQTIINELVQGNYAFELTVTDDKGAIGKDTINIKVNPAPQSPATPSAGDYFPYTTGSEWMYYYLNDGDVKEYYDSTAWVSTGETKVIGGKTYFAIKDNFYDCVFRKDGNGNYYRYGLITWTDETQDVKDEVIFLKENVPAGTVWETPTYNGTEFGVPVKFKTKFTVMLKGTTMTVNGNTYNDIIVIQEEGLVNYGAGFKLSERLIISYAKGIGMIQVNEPFDKFKLELKHFKIK